MKDEGERGHHRLVLPSALAAQIIAHARAGYPEEVCGLVAGSWRRGAAGVENLTPLPPSPARRGGGEAPPSLIGKGAGGLGPIFKADTEIICVEAVVPGRNVSPTPRVAYEMDVETVARQIEFEDNGLSLVAIYHSHPHGPETPSDTDIARAFYPDAVYLILSLAEPDRPVLRGYRIVAGSVDEVALVPAESTLGASLT